MNWLALCLRCGSRSLLIFPRISLDSAEPPRQPAVIVRANPLPAGRLVVRALIMAVRLASCWRAELSSDIIFALFFVSSSALQRPSSSPVNALEAAVGTGHSICSAFWSVCARDESAHLTECLASSPESQT